MAIDIDFSKYSLDSLKEFYCNFHLIVYHKIPEANEYPYNSTEQNRDVLIAQCKLLQQLSRR